MRRIYLIVILPLIALALLAGCGGQATPPPPPPTPTLVATIAPPTPTPQPIADAELLGAARSQAICDAPPAALFTCTDEQTAPQLEVNVTAATYARWSLQWEGMTPLSGDETLTLRLNHSGALAPNLYLVENSGRRVGVALARFGLREGEQTLQIPLREIRDQEGNLPDFASVNELQIVFEWADMQGMLALTSLRFASVWVEPVAISDSALALAAGLTLPDGFAAEVVLDNVRELTQIQFTPVGDMLVSLQNGRIWWYRDLDSDGRYDQRHLYATGFIEIVGLLYDPLDGAVWTGGRGQLFRLFDGDGNGVADQRQTRLEGLPWGRHQNNGLVWNPGPDPFSGETAATWLYFGIGSTDDLTVGGEYNATIARFPRDGQGLEDLEVVSQGNRNAYGLVWADLPVDLAEPNGPTAWQLFASENGPDFNDAPDEVNHIRWGYHYGFPEQFGPVAEESAEGDPYSSPVYPVTPHASADGLAYINNPAWPAQYRTLYVSLFGEVFNPVPVGHIVEGIHLRTEITPNGEMTYRGEPFTLVDGLDRPLPLVTGPDGNLLVGDYATGVIYRIVYAGGESGEGE